MKTIIQWVRSKLKKQSQKITTATIQVYSEFIEPNILEINIYPCPEEDDPEGTEPPEDFKEYEHTQKGNK